MEANGDLNVMTVAVTDVAAAEADLMRTVMASPELTVVDFRKRAAGLEEVFIGLVESGR